MSELATENETFKTGNWVVFFAYNHPQCVDRLLVDSRFLYLWPYEAPVEGSEAIAFYDSTPFPVPEPLLAYQGWSPFAEIPVDQEVVRAALATVAEGIHTVLLKNSMPSQELPANRRRPTQERTTLTNSSNSQQTRLKAALFGLGNYAKTVIIPYLDPHIEISCIHEVDPTQLGPVSQWKTIAIDTAGYPREDERYEVYFIAGYHHTHCSIALHTLQQGAHAVVEKPIVTTREQLNALRQGLETVKSSFFACFHKRYSLLNELAWTDLKVKPGEPVNYNCIVFEVPLLRRHWYTWPASGSRLASNGCHWIDHFMYFNGYTSVLRKDVKEMANGDVVVFIELENGAVFTMTLSDVGSKRLGVRDYIELRSGDVTVRMIDSGRYESENHRQLLRRKRFNRMHSYARMYKIISNRIATGEPGDSLQSLRSSELVIDLEEELQHARRAINNQDHFA